MLEKNPNDSRKKRPSLNVNGKNEYFSELHNPSYINGDIVAENDLKKCESLGIIEIKFYDKKIFLPLSKRKVSIFFNIEFETLCRRELDLQLSTVSIEWKEAISTSSLSTQIKSILMNSQPIIIEGRNAAEIIERIEQYSNLERKNDFVRMASAYMFWGLSKVLDNKSDIWSCLNIKPAPIRLNAWGPSNASKKILFIENQQTFEAAQLHPEIFGKFILVYSSGFAGTSNRLNNSFGRSIYFNINTLRSEEHANILESCLDGDTSIEAFFWGDLDYAGINIFLSLKKLIPSVSLWGEGYYLMVEKLKDYAHTPLQSKKEGQADPGKTGLSYIDEILLPAIRKYGFFDQEGILFTMENHNDK